MLGKDVQIKFLYVFMSIVSVLYSVKCPICSQLLSRC